VRLIDGFACLLVKPQQECTFGFGGGKTRAGKAELGENGLGNGFQNKQ